MRKSTYLALAFGGLMLSAGVLAADDKPADGKIEPAAVDLGRPIDFTKDVQPILDDKCVACHNVAIAESRLILEDAPSIMKGGKRGPSVVPKDPEKSLLYILAARGQQPAMPPLPNKASAEAVTPQELGILKQWILEGAQGGMGSSGPAVAFQAVPESLHAIYSIALSPWSRYAVCSRANQIDVYDVVTGEYVQRLVDPALSTLTSKDQPMYPHGAAHQDFVHALAYSPTADLIASAGYREVKLWQRGQNVQLKKFAIENVPTATAVSPDGKLLAAAMPDHAIRLISLADGAPQKSLAGHTLPVTSLQFTADGSKLYSASNDKSVRVWNIADGAQVDVLETPAEVLSFAWNADGKLLLTGHQDNLIRSWNIPFDKPGAEPVKSVRDYAGSGGPVTALTLVAPGAHFLSAGADGHWREWDLASGAAVRAINHGAPVTSLSVRNDGKLVATAGANVGKLWSIEGQPVGEIKGNLAAQRKVVVMTEDDAVAKAHVALADASFKAAEKNLTERTEAVKKANEQKEAADKALAEAKTKEEAAVAARDEAQKKLEGDASNDGLKKAKEEADKALTAAQEATKKAQEAVDAAVKTIAQTTKAQQTADEQQKAAKTVLDNETTLGKQAEERLNAAKAELPATEKPLFQLAFSPDGKFLAATGEDGVVRLYDGKTARPLEELVNQPAAPTRVLLFGVDRALISIADDKQVIVWDSNPPFQLVGVLGPKTRMPLDCRSVSFHQSRAESRLQSRRSRCRRR
ncbi:MAG: c-type cytochrome domain-containing protein [Planctomycetaceae bacterium]